MHCFGSVNNKQLRYACVVFKEPVICLGGLTEQELKTPAGFKLFSGQERLLL